MQTDECYIKIIVYLLGIGGFMFGIIGGLVAYIFREHVKDNHMQLSKNYDEHKEFDKRMREGGI